MKISPAGTSPISIRVGRRVPRQQCLGAEYASVRPSLIIAEANDALTLSRFKLSIVRDVAIVITGHKMVVLAAIIKPRLYRELMTEASGRAIREITKGIHHSVISSQYLAIG